MLGSCLELARFVLGGHSCPSCGDPAPFGDAFCGPCELALLPDPSDDAAFLYGGPIADFVRAWKYEGRAELTRVAARLLHESPAWRGAVDSGVELVVPIPLHPRKLRRRGYHVVALLAGALIAREKRERRRSCSPVLSAAPNALSRSRDDPPQASLGEAARRDNVAGAFDVRAPCRVAGRRILLLDDVRTTDTTLNEAARVLLAHGATSVRCLAFSRSGKI